MYEDIVARHRPKGWRVSFTRRKGELAARIAANPTASFNQNIGLADFDARTIYAPPVVDLYTLSVVLHEFGHVALGHGTTREPVHRQEFEAERWSLEVMRLHGLRVPRELLERCRGYVRNCINKDRADGHPIQAHVARWAHG